MYGKEIGLDKTFLEEILKSEDRFFMRDGVSYLRKLLSLKNNKGTDGLLLETISQYLHFSNIDLYFSNIDHTVQYLKEEHEKLNNNWWYIFGKMPLKKKIFLMLPKIVEKD